MNRVHKTLWSESAQCWQAVPETAKAAGKRSVKSASGGVLATVVMGLALSGGAGAQSPPPPASSQLPTGGSVARGSATIAQTATAQAAAMTVNQSSQRAIINWDSFNLGTAASINFVQPNAQAVTLNRVNDNNPSQIFGRITSNGQVFLSNPSGVYFSPTASVDVGALVATSHSISDAHFMAGNYQFERNGATGKVINEGRINAALGGYVALLAPEVQNAGVVLARAGTVALAAGEVISLQVQGGGLAGITTTPSAIATLIENKLAVQAPDGQIILSAVALNKLQAGVIKNSGSLEANSLVAKGGKIYLEADDITLAATSRIQAKGPTGGGTVLVGGDWQGTGDMRQATKVTMEAGASIDASATDQGDGGKVVLWSDIHQDGGFTRVNGRIQAEAGPNGGNGGQVETSGHGLEVGEAVISAQSFKGNDGLWLLDPYNIIISSSANASTTKSGSTFSASASGGVVNATTLQTALATSSVTVSTTGAGADAGNITLSSDLSWSSNKVFTLTANGGISGTGNIAMSGASGTGVVFNQAGTSNYSGNISGTNATVTKQGVGVLTLSGNNTYGGITTVSAGTLKIGSATALGAATNNDADRTDIATGATLDLNSFSLNERLLISGTLTNSSVNAVTAYTGTTQLIGTVGTAVVIQADAGAINLAAMLGVPPNGVELGGSTGGSFSGIIGASTSNQPKVTKNGSGTWAFNGTESYLRDVLTIQAGTLKLGSLNTNFFGNIVTGVNISTAGAVLEMANNNALNVTKPIYGSGSVLKSGAGTLTLNSSSNAYSGGTTVANGILKAGTVFGGSSSAHFGTGRVTVMSGAALDVQGNSLSVPITINGTGVNSGGALTNGTSGTSDVTLSGLLTLGSDSAIVNNASGNSALKLTNVGTITGNGYALTLGGSQGGTISSIIGTGSGSITKTGAGTWTLSGVNTFTGNVFVNEGYLIANNSNALGTAVGYTQVASGASLGIAGATDFAEPLILSGFGYSDTVAALHSQTTATLNYTGTMTLSGTTRIGVTSGKTLNIKTSVDNGVFDIVKYSTGTLNFQGTPQTGVAAASIGLSGTGTLKTGSAFVKATASTSVYGSSPVISYAIYSSAAASTALTGLSITGTAEFTGAPISTSSAGSYSLKYDKGLSSTRAFFPVTAATTWVVAKAPLIVTANNASKTYDGLGYTGGDGVSYSVFANNETTAVLGGTLSYGGTSQGATNAGSYAITPAGLTSSNYAITFVNGALTINKAPLTVTANNASKTYGDANPSLSTTVSGFVNGETLATSGVAGTGAATTTATTSTGAGTATITAGVGSLTAANYDFSNWVNGTLTINKAPLTVTANNASKTYGDANPTLSTTVSGFVNGETLATSGVAGSGSATTTATTTTAVGTAVITAGVGSLTASNYDFSHLVDGSLTIQAAPAQPSNNANQPVNPGQVMASLVVSVVIPPVVAPIQPAPALPAPPGPAPEITIAPTAPLVAEAPVNAPAPVAVAPAPAPVVVAALPQANTDNADNPDNKDRPTAAAAPRDTTTPSLQGEQVAYLRPAVTSAPAMPAAIPAAPSPAAPVATPLALAPANVQLATAAPEAARPVAAVASVNAPTTNVVSSGVLPITILRGNNAQPTSAGVAFEQNADTVSLRATDAPLLPPSSERLVFNDRLTTFMVANGNGTMVEFQGSLVNNRMVIVAPSNAAKLVAQTDMNIVLAAAVTSLGRESRVMLAQLDSVVLDLR